MAGKKTLVSDGQEITLVSDGQDIALVSDGNGKDLTGPHNPPRQDREPAGAEVQEEGQRRVPESRSEINMSFLFFSMHFKGILVGGETPGLLPMRDPPGEANAARRSDAVWIRWKGGDAT